MGRPRIRQLAARAFALVVLAGCSRASGPALAEPDPGLSAASEVDAATLQLAQLSASAMSTSACGVPPCPLYDWMRANTGPSMRAADFGALEGELARLAMWAPPGYPHWASIARDGASAARAQLLDATRGACRSCHVQYRERYKLELRARPLSAGDRH
jgi:hypothetical protein